MTFNDIMHEMVRRQQEAIRNGENSQRAVVDYLDAVHDGLAAAAQQAEEPASAAGEASHDA